MPCSSATLRHGRPCVDYFRTAVIISVFLPGLKGGKVLIWEKGTFVRGLYILRAPLRVILHFEGTMEKITCAYLKRKQYNYDLNIISFNI